MNKHLEILGLRCEDLVTGFSGVVTTVSFDLYGCIQVIITPPMKDGKKQDGEWFDVNRIKLLSTDPVMSTPDWNNNVYVSDGLKGGCQKPLP